MKATHRNPLKPNKVAILGATGAVGGAFLELLERRKFPVDTLVLLASHRSAGRTVRFRGTDIVIQDAASFDFAGTDLVFMSAGASVSEVYVSKAIKAGAVVIDNSSAYRLIWNVPLVVPEINPEDAYSHYGIIANPNCTTIIALVGLEPIRRAFGVSKIFGASYQAVSGAGQSGIAELLKEECASGLGLPEVTPRVFPHQIYHNVIPCIGSPTTSGYTTEERKLAREGAKIMHNPALRVSITCVRVPVIRAHTVALEVECDPRDPVSIDEVHKVMSTASGVRLVDDLSLNLYPLPRTAELQERVLVGRVRKSEIFDNGVAFVVSGDQLWKGAALNAIQIAELLMQA